MDPSSPPADGDPPPVDASAVQEPVHEDPIAGVRLGARTALPTPPGPVDTEGGWTTDTDELDGW